MVKFTSNTYQMKREILSFSNKISRKLPKPERNLMHGVSGTYVYEVRNKHP